MITCISCPKQNHKISIVIPAYNEDGNLRELYSELMKILPTLDKSWEIIFVDDGSTDKTWEEILLSSIKFQRTPIPLGLSFPHTKQCPCSGKVRRTLLDGSIPSSNSDQ